MSAMPLKLFLSLILDIATCPALLPTGEFSAKWRSCADSTDGRETSSLLCK